MNIAVIIPCFNAGTFITRALDSVLKQVDPVSEIIVVDDGSLDDTVTIVKVWHLTNPSANLKIVQQQNQGVSIARNNAVKNTNCQWVCFLDADDEWLPEHNTVLAKLFWVNSSAKFLFADGIRFRNGNLIGNFFSTRNITSEQLTFQQLNYEMIRGSFIPMCSTAFDRDTFLAETGFNTNFHYGEDRELIMRFFGSYPYSYSLQSISKVHYHNTNATSAANRLKMETGLVDLNYYIKVNSSLYSLDEHCKYHLEEQIKAKLKILSYVTSELGVISYINSRFFPKYFITRDFTRAILQSLRKIKNKNKNKKLNHNKS
jgi:glycosyltransferase involved in cell wall biosynthesis